LRWVTLYRLSPWHGFLHEPTADAFLCYDIMEPYRFWFEQAAKQSGVEVGDDVQKLTAVTINKLKGSAERDVAVPQALQILARKNFSTG